MNILYFFKTDLIMATFLGIVVLYIKRFFSRKSSEATLLNLTSMFLILALLSEAICIFIQKSYTSLNESLTITTNIIAITCATSSILYIMCWFLFLVSYINKEKRLSKKLYNLTISTATIIILLIGTSSFTNLIFKINPNGPTIYSEGPLQPLLTLFQSIYILLCLIYLISRKKYLSKFEFNILISLNLIQIFSGFIEFFFKSLPVSLSISSVPLIITYIVLQDNISNYDYTTKLLKRKTFDKFMTSFEKENNKEYSIVYIEFSDYMYLRSKYGKDEQMKTLKTFSNILRESISIKEKAVYYENDEFVLFIPSRDDRYILEVLKRINGKLNECNNKGELKCNLKYIYSICKYNDSLKNYSMVIRKAYNNMYEKKHTLNFFKEV